MKINVVCVGNLKEKFWKDACDEYKKRLSRFCNLKIVELSEQNKYVESEKIIQEEGKEILNCLKGQVFLLDIQGQLVSSEDLANKIKKESSFVNEMTFVIGGSYGVSQAVKNFIKDKISFGKITLPHNIARVVLLEQIYRAFMINSNSKYHK